MPEYSPRANGQAVIYGTAFVLSVLKLLSAVEHAWAQQRGLVFPQPRAVPEERQHLNHCWAGGGCGILPSPFWCSWAVYSSASGRFHHLVCSSLWIFKHLNIIPWIVLFNILNTCFLPPVTFCSTSSPAPLRWPCFLQHLWKVSVFGHCSSPWSNTCLGNSEGFANLW